MIPNQKILVVDDEHPIADTLAAILQQNGFDVYVAYTGNRAIEIALQIEPDLLVSDVMMPDKKRNRSCCCRESKTSTMQNTSFLRQRGID